MQRYCGGIVDEVEGSTQQKHNKYVKDEPEQVETYSLFDCPLTCTQGEALLLQGQLKGHRKKYVRT